MFFFRVVNGFLFSMLKLMSFILTETLLYACPTITSFFFEIILKLFIHQEQWMLHPVSLSFSFSTERPPPRSAWIKIPGNIRGPGTIGLSPRTRVLLQDFKTSRLIWSDLIWSDLIWSDLIWSDLIWSDLIWSDLIWSDLIWSDLIWSDLIWCDLKVTRELNQGSQFKVLIKWCDCFNSSYSFSWLVLIYHFCNPCCITKFRGFLILHYC